MAKPEVVLGAVIGRARNLFPNGGVKSDEGAWALEFEGRKAGYIGALSELAAATYLTIIAHANLHRANQLPRKTIVQDQKASEIVLQELRILTMGERSLVRMNRSLASWDTLKQTLTDKKTQTAGLAFMSEIQRAGEERLIELVRDQRVEFAGVVLTDKGGMVKAGELDFLNIVRAFSGEGLEAAFFACQSSEEGRDKIRAFINDKDSLII